MAPTSEGQLILQSHIGTFDDIVKEILNLGRRTSIQLSDERVVPGRSNNDLVQLHISRYLFAANFIIPSGTVLDVGCGVGYGGLILRRVAKHVVSLDIDPDAVWTAKKSFNLRNVFVGTLESITSSPVFDAICALEVIEHVVDDKQFVEGLALRVKPGGKVIMSTPYAAISQGPRSPYHVREYMTEAFIDLVSSYFNDVRVFLQGIKVNPYYQRLEKVDRFAFRHLIPKRLRRFAGRILDIPVSGDLTLRSIEFISYPPAERLPLVFTNTLVVAKP